MLSFRRFIAMFLIIALVAVVFYVQEVKADPCEDAMDLCKSYWDFADLVCDHYGHSSLTCLAAIDYTIQVCAYYIARHCNAA